MNETSEKTIVEKAALTDWRCSLGLHDYVHDADYFMGIVACAEVWLQWKTCRRCGKFKLTGITR